MNSTKVYRIIDHSPFHLHREIHILVVLALSPSFTVGRCHYILQGPAACATNPGCVALGITTGFCCPSFSGERLACCTEQHVVGDGGESDGDKEVDPDALCSANEG